MKRQNIKEKIKKFFFINPTIKLRVRQIERKLKFPLPSVIRYVTELEKERILKKTKIENVVFYSADRSSKTYIIEKRIFNLREIFISGIVNYLIDEYSNPTIILFGSYSKGEDIENSDVDLYIETPKKYSFNLARFEEILNRKIQVFNYRNIKEIQNPNLANSIINGIILNGFIEVFK